LIRRAPSPLNGERAGVRGGVTVEPAKQVLSEGPTAAYSGPHESGVRASLRRGDALRLVLRTQSRSGLFHGISLMRMRRYSIFPRSPSRPMGPLTGTFMAASKSSPLQRQ